MGYVMSLFTNGFVNFIPFTKKIIDLLKEAKVILK